MVQFCMQPFSKTVYLLTRQIAYFEFRWGCDLCSAVHRNQEFFAIHYLASELFGSYRTIQKRLSNQIRNGNEQKTTMNNKNDNLNNKNDNMNDKKQQYEQRCRSYCCEYRNAPCTFEIEMKYNVYISAHYLFLYII